MSGRVIAACEAWNIWAVEKMGAPTGWSWTTIRVLENAGPKRFDEIEGAIYSTMLKSGPRKGRRNVKKPDAGTFRSFIVDHEEWFQWWKAWLIAHDICPECEGHGRKSTRWSKVEGSFYRPCPLACAASVGAVLHEPPAAAEATP